MPVEPNLPAPSNPILSKRRSASGGVNTFSSPLDINDDQVVDFTNGIASVPGLQEVRPGTAVVASGITHGPILALSEFTPSSFSTELIAVTPGATYPNAAHLKAWKWAGTGNWTLIGTLSGFTAPTLPIDIVTGLDFNAPGGPAIARFVTQQTLPYHYFYGGGGITTCSGLASVPFSGPFFPMGTALNRAFGAGLNATARGLLCYSDVASFTVTGWHGTNQSIKMGGGTKQEIIALKEFRQGTIICFMQDRTEALQLDGDPISVTPGAVAAGSWSRKTIDTTIGCGSRRTVQTVGKDLFFVDQHGNVRSLERTITDNDQGTKSLPISANIQSWIDRINAQYLETAQAASYSRYYLVSLPIDSAVTPSHTFVYDIINAAWYGPWIGTWSQVGSLAVATLNGASNAADQSPTVYIGGASTGNGMVYRTFYGTTDDTAPIIYSETTKRESFGTLDAKKKPLRHRSYAFPSAGATAMVEARKDGGDWKTLGYVDLSGASPQLPLTGPIDFGNGGIVEFVASLESNFELARDLQVRKTVTASQAVQFLGDTMQVLLRNIDWEVTS